MVLRKVPFLALVTLILALEMAGMDSGVATENARDLKAVKRSKSGDTRQAGKTQSLASKARSVTRRMPAKKRGDEVKRIAASSKSAASVKKTLARAGGTVLTGFCGLALGRSGL